MMRSREVGAAPGADVFRGGEPSEGPEGQEKRPITVSAKQ